MYIYIYMVKGEPYIYIYICIRNTHTSKGDMSFIKVRFYHPKMGCSGCDVCRGLTVLPPCFQGFEAFPAVCFSTGRVWCMWSSSPG